MNQDIGSQIVEALTLVENYISVRPDATLQLLLLASVLTLLSVLLLVRQRQGFKRTIRRQQAEIERLNRRIEEGGVAARVEREQKEQVAVPPFQAEIESLTAVEPEHAEARPVEPIAVATPKGFETKESAGASRIGRGLQKSRAGLLSRLASFLSGHARVDVSALDDLEEVLIASDVGARCAAELVSVARQVAEKQGQLAPSELKAILEEGIVRSLVPVDAGHRIYKPDLTPLVVLVVGVNGAGKTTTVAKLAAKYIGQGKKVLAIAADTFRAAAVEQLAEWSARVGFTLVRGPEGAKPSGVVFDGMVAAKQGAYDVVLIDTAGRLHTKSNLMQELEGVRNVIRKHVPEGPHETVLVLDGVSGQNALSQAREFNAAVRLSGVAVTKLDGSPKGGIIIAISKELNLPVFYIGIGEKTDDLVPFDRALFARALFEDDEDGAREERGFVGNS